MRQVRVKLMQLEELSQRIAGLEELFAEKMRYDEQKERAFDELYNELSMYKNNFVEQSLLGVYKDIILLYDNVTRSLQEMTREEQAGTDLAEFAEFVLTEIVEILYRRGIELIDSSEYFDASIQRAVAVEYVSEPGLDNKVLRVVRRGFRSELRVIRPEEVVVARYRAEGGEQA
ncbi:MAG TPA: nucleotide exchange factor GrpE [Limnochordia bacterium]|nr:nucleotide exchange factor GrpE [Limnochordia bacterium]